MKLELMNAVIMAEDYAALRDWWDTDRNYFVNTEAEREARGQGGRSEVAL